jgi:hypothetical protein
VQTVDHVTAHVLSNDQDKQRCRGNTKEQADRVHLALCGIVCLFQSRDGDVGRWPLLFLRTVGKRWWLWLYCRLSVATTVQDLAQLFRACPTLKHTPSTPAIRGA